MRPPLFKPSAPSPSVPKPLSPSFPRSLVPAPLSLLPCPCTFVPVLCSLLLAVIVALIPPLARAQFQPVNPDELKMTSDPKAPGAPAVCLEFREIDNDPLHSISIYARYKVLTEKGKELATVEIPYFAGAYHVAEIKARTIHSDGTIVPLTGNPNDLLSVKSGDMESGRSVFNLPSVEVGSVLEYSFRITYNENIYMPPSWPIQRQFFIHKAHYQYTPFKDFMPPPFGPPAGFAGSFLMDGRGRAINSLVWWQNLPEGVKLRTEGTTGAGYYAVDMTDVPPLPDEEWMPPLDSVRYRVQFYYKYESNVADFWKTESALWSKDVDHFAEPTKAIRNAVDGIVASGDSDLDKAQKLYAAIQALDNTNFSRQKSASELKELKLKPPRRAEDTWKQKSGSANDLALLYLSMLRAAGLNAYAAIVTDRGDTVFDPGYMYFDQLSEMLVILDSGGKQIYLDPGEKMCPFGLLHWRHSGATGIRQSAHGLEMTTTAEQNYLANTVNRTGSVDVDQHGGVTGSFNFVFSGQAALRWRQEALRNDLSEVKRQFDEQLKSEFPSGVEAHVDHFLGLDRYDSNLIAAVRIDGRLGSAMADRLVLPAFFFTSLAPTGFVREEKRQTPVDMRFGDTVIDDVTYHLPPGYTVEGAPEDTSISWPNHAIYTAQIKSDPGQIDLVRSFARGFSLSPPTEYQDLRGFFQKVAASDQQQIVLNRAPAKGN